MTDGPRTLSLFAGPGGMDEAARILGVDLGPTLGVEINPDACATARAAGSPRIQADVSTLNPADFPTVTGLIVTPPCPTFSAAGKGSGRGDDYQTALDAITDLGTGCTCGYEHARATVEDVRTALVIEAARWAFGLPNVQWLICEQVPALEHLWEDLTAELTSGTYDGEDQDEESDYPGWVWADVVTVDAADYGAAARRTRTFLLARRYWDCAAPVSARPGSLSVHPSSPIPQVTAADALGWPAGEHMRTRGNRKATGGNLFSTDGPSWCMTGKARSWERDSDGERMSTCDAGAMTGFPRDYPWQGSRSSQFQQAGDVVSPLCGAAVLGTVLGIEWEPAVRARAASLAAGPPELLRNDEGQGVLLLA